MIDRNALGDRGEHIFYVAVSRLHGERPLFRPVLLGGKWPVADVAVELEGEPGMFFLAQVKTSSRGYTTSERLRIHAPQEGLQSLANAPVPTYIIGVDEPGEKVFLAAVRGTVTRSRASITTAYSVNDASVREKLYQEVRVFWVKVRSGNSWPDSQFDESEGDVDDGED